MAIARPTNPRNVDSRAVRYQRVATMRQEGFTFEEIGAVIGRSGERARQILEAGPPPHGDGSTLLASSCAPGEFDLLTRRAELRARIEGLTTTWRATRRQLREVDEELEARRIDRLLGLPEQRPASLSVRGPASRRLPTGTA